MLNMNADWRKLFLYMSVYEPWESWNMRSVWNRMLHVQLSKLALCSFNNSFCKRQKNGSTYGNYILLLHFRGLWCLIFVTVYGLRCLLYVTDLFIAGWNLSSVLYSCDNCDNSLTEVTGSKPTRFSIWLENWNVFSVTPYSWWILFHGYLRYLT